MTRKRSPAGLVHSTVRILVDGEEVLTREGDTTGNDAEHLLDTDALVPQATPRRIAFYGCGCGEFGCHCVAGLVSESDGLVRWHDFRTVTGVYHCALPPAGVEADALGDPDIDWDLLDLPDLAFDAADYHRAFDAARTDRSWESRPRVIVRLVRDRARDVQVWAAARDDVITVQHRGRAMLGSTDLPVPDGPVEPLADALLRLLAQHDPREIAACSLWR